MRTTLALTVAAVGTAIGVTAGGVLVSDARSAPSSNQQSQLIARSVLPANTFQPDSSPPSGAFLAAGDRATAAGNGVTGPAAPAPYFAHQPIQGISSMVPAADGAWWALADNGYGTRQTSADWQLPIYRLDLNLGSSGVPTVRETVVLSDPDHRIPWAIVCDPTAGSPLPPLSFNVLPASPPPACGTTPGARILTGFDLDPESVAIGADGTFWIGEEFGPFILHADRKGRLLDTPIAYPGVKSPQNPTLDVARGERPNVAQSRGFESLAISPDRTRLSAMFEGAVADDDPQDVRIVTFDIARRRFTGEFRRLRLEMPGAKADLSALKLTDGTPAYPGAVAPTGTGGQSAAELTSLDGDRFLLVERDGNGDGPAAPRFKKVFVVDAGDTNGRGDYVAKRPLVDLMAVPDPNAKGGDGDYFRFPFNTIESVHVVSDHTILVANDNNYPFSNARSRSRSLDRTGPLAPDDNEFIVVQVSTSLHPDRRLLPR